MATVIDQRNYSTDGSLIFPPYEPEVFDRTPCTENGLWELGKISETCMYLNGNENKWLLGYGRVTYDKYQEYHEFAVWYVPDHDPELPEDEQLQAGWTINDVKFWFAE